MTSWVSRLRGEPASAPATRYLSNPFSPDAASPKTIAKIRDANAPDWRYQVNQKCIYERRLPGGSHITCHVQRLQSGFYDSPVVHEDRIDNVRFVALHFVFHPSRSKFRFTSAEIKIALHHDHQDDSDHEGRYSDMQAGGHNHGTQTSRQGTNNFNDPNSQALVRSHDVLPRPAPRKKPIRPKFLRHAPHLLFGAISPETLDWNFNLAGSVGVSQGPASASIQPSYGVKSSYKIYEMMKIQGSVRTLRHWGSGDYDVEDGELTWTLEENKLQKSGLPREFTFVMLLTKGSGPIDWTEDVRLEIDIKPRVSARLGGSYPMLVTDMPQYQPFRKEDLNLDQEIGQRFGPEIPGKGFNFANIATSFDDFVYLPGTTYSKSDAPPSDAPAPKAADAQPPQNGSAQPPKRQAQLLPGVDGNTLNLRVFLESSRSNASLVQAAQSPFITLKPPISRAQSQSLLPQLHHAATAPVPQHQSRALPEQYQHPAAPSLARSNQSASQRSSGRRSIIISHNAPSSHAQSQRQPQSIPQESNATPQKRLVSTSHSLRRSHSRSSLVKEYQASSSPTEPRIVSIHESVTEPSSAISMGENGHGGLYTPSKYPTYESRDPAHNDDGGSYGKQAMDREATPLASKVLNDMIMDQSSVHHRSRAAEKAQRDMPRNQSPSTSFDGDEDSLSLHRTGTLDKEYSPQATANRIASTSSDERSRTLTIANPDSKRTSTTNQLSSKGTGTGKLTALPAVVAPTVNNTAPPNSNNHVNHNRDLSSSTFSSNLTGSNTIDSSASAETQLLSPPAAIPNRAVVSPHTGVWNDTPSSWATAATHNTANTTNTDTSFHTAPLSREGSIRTTGSKRSSRRKYAYPDPAGGVGSGSGNTPRRSSPVPTTSRAGATGSGSIARDGNRNSAVQHEKSSDNNDHSHHLIPTTISPPIFSSAAVGAAPTATSSGPRGKFFDDDHDGEDARDNKEDLPVYGDDLRHDRAPLYQYDYQDPRVGALERAVAAKNEEDRLQEEQWDRHDPRKGALERAVAAKLNEDRLEDAKFDARDPRRGALERAVAAKLNEDRVEDAEFDARDPRKGALDRAVAAKITEDRFTEEEWDRRDPRRGALDRAVAAKIDEDKLEEAEFDARDPRKGALDRAVAAKLNEDNLREEQWERQDPRKSALDRAVAAKITEDNLQEEEWERQDPRKGALDKAVAAKIDEDRARERKEGEAIGYEAWKRSLGKGEGEVVDRGHEEGDELGVARERWPWSVEGLI